MDRGLESRGHDLFSDTLLESNGGQKDVKSNVTKIGQIMWNSQKFVHEFLIARENWIQKATTFSK